MNFNKEPIIHVGIFADETIDFQLNGTFTFNGQKIDQGFYSALINEGAIETSFCYEKKIHLVPENNSTFVLQKVLIGTGFHWQQYEDQEFEGELLLQIEENKIRALNNIPVEKYLKSVISSEMSAMNDTVLLQVHAIVSRSWLLAQLNRKHLRKETARLTVSADKNNNRQEFIKWYDREDHSTFDVCADDHCQRYQGITKVISKNAEKAVESTKGQVIVINNEICDARFSKCCGGITENFENVWQPEHVPYLTSIPDADAKKGKNAVDINNEKYYKTSPKAFCNTSDPSVLKQIMVDFDQETINFYRWKVEYSQQEIAELITRKSEINFGNIIDLVPLERGPSGRIIRLKIAGTNRVMVVGKELEIRKWLSESHLYSSAFVVEKNGIIAEDLPEKFILHGAGWGHGVGLCQIGAACMSRKGYSVEQILKHYYRDTMVKKVY
ncbi:MAG: SpoIID/LytB domain-containing protein [Prolixibacteraceae bacterium]|nr:SpoIID/LytB domain-containing protein [Prolixibacteraceae bacterium]